MNVCSEVDVFSLTECSQVDARPAALHDDSDRQGGALQVHAVAKRCVARQVQRDDGQGGRVRQRVGSSAGRCHVHLPSHPSRDDRIR